MEELLISVNGDANVYFLSTFSLCLRRNLFGSVDLCAPDCKVQKKKNEISVLLNFASSSFVEAVCWKDLQFNTTAPHITNSRLHKDGSIPLILKEVRCSNYCESVNFSSHERGQSLTKKSKYFFLFSRQKKKKSSKQWCLLLHIYDHVSLHTHHRTCEWGSSKVGKKTEQWGEIINIKIDLKNCLSWVATIDWVHTLTQISREG